MNRRSLIGTRTLALALLGTLTLTLAVSAVPASAASAATSFAGFGEGAGQVEHPVGVAVGSSGTVYVADNENDRVDEFDGEGAFELAFGFGVENGEGKLERCTTATGCRKGIAGPEAGEIRPTAVAVDDSGGSSKGDVYVSDLSNYRVEKFDSGGISC